AARRREDDGSQLLAGTRRVLVLLGGQRRRERERHDQSAEHACVRFHRYSLRGQVGVRTIAEAGPGAKRHGKLQSNATLLLDLCPTEAPGYLTWPLLTERSADSSVRPGLARRSTVARRRSAQPSTNRAIAASAARCCRRFHRPRRRSNPSSCEGSSPR